MRKSVAAVAVLWASAAAAGEPGWIVVLHDDASPREVAAAHGVQTSAVYRHALRGFAFAGSARAAQALERDGRVRGVVPDGWAHADCHLDDPQVLPSGVDRIGADQSALADIDGVDERVNADVAIVDSGIYPHQDLNVFRAVDCTRRGGCRVVSPSDPNGHGTHVAGTAAAIDDANGVVGVAPGARLWQVRVLNSQGSGKWSWIIAGLDYVAANAASIEVANMSLGGTGSVRGVCGVSGGRVVDAIHAAVCGVVSHGVVLAVAAGNESDDARNHVPAAYPEAVTVSALDDSNDTFAGFSNFGPAVDLIAPGVSIYSTYPGTSSFPAGYCATLSGTSMASPHVAGSAALYALGHGRDLDHDGDVDGNDVAAAAAAMRSLGRCPNGSAAGAGCPGSWPGDPDGVAEPLVWPASF